MRVFLSSFLSLSFSSFLPLKKRLTQFIWLFSLSFSLSLSFFILSLCVSVSVIGEDKFVSFFKSYKIFKNWWLYNYPTNSLTPRREHIGDWLLYFTMNYLYVWFHWVWFVLVWYGLIFLHYIRSFLVTPDKIWLICKYFIAIISIFLMFHWLLSFVYNNFFVHFNYSKCSYLWEIIYRHTTDIFF